MSGTGTRYAIPADDIVSINPSVLAAGGTTLDLTGIVLTTSPRVPLGMVPSFPSQVSVADYFGAESAEATFATNYFLGFDNSTKKPGALSFAQFNTSAVGAWLRGGSLAGTALATLKAITTGTITITIDGTPVTSATINLSSATSYSNAAELLSVALGVLGPETCSFHAAIADDVMTVDTITTGAIAVGDEIQGTDVAPGTVVSAFGTGTTGGAGTYTLSIGSQTVSAEAMTANIPAVTWDAISSAFIVRSATTGGTSTIGYASGADAAALALTEATGAVTSQGASAASVTTTMNNIVAQTRNWASFTFLQNPDNSGHTIREAMMSWCNGRNKRYWFVCWDADSAPTTSNNATGSLGQALLSAAYEGTTLIYSPTQGTTIAAFLMGAGASIDFTERRGRATMKFRSQSGITPDVTDWTKAENLRANGYNFYGVWATAAQRFTFFSDGTVSGTFRWIDSYLNQIWMTDQFQDSLMLLMSNAKAIPYNQYGYGLIRQAMADPIQAAFNFGAFVNGVPLSGLQAAIINGQTTNGVDRILTAQGFYLQILDASPAVRQNRGSPPVRFWFTDGQSIQSINVSTVNVQ